MTFHITLAIPKDLKRIAIAIHQAGGRSFVVGGAVRDTAMAKIRGKRFVSKDFDVEVFGLSWQSLVALLSQFGKVDEVGKSFGVIKVKINGVEFDFSLPRRESKMGRGHRGFKVEFDPHMTITEACARRDFTINALCVDIITGELHDPFNGIQDIIDGWLRPTSEHFADDALRVLRGFQFAGRFMMKLHPSAFDMCRKLACEFIYLSDERVREEWVKWSLKSVKPSMGLEFLRDAGWLFLWPEINSLHSRWNTDQDGKWHPEGDVFIHTAMGCDAIVQWCDENDVSDEERLIEVFGILCHDFAKPETFEIGVDGRIHNPGHDKEGAIKTLSFLRRLFKPEEFFDARSGEWVYNDSAFIKMVVELVVLHMRHIGFIGNRGQVRRLALRVPMKLLRGVVTADHSARPFNGVLTCPEAMIHMLQVAEEVAVIDAQPKKIIEGRHLIVDKDGFNEFGFTFKPGKIIGIMVQAAFEAQMDDAFADVDGGISWVKNWIEENSISQ